MLYTLKNPEPSQPRHAMVIAADAKAIGAIGAMRVGGGIKKPRTRVRATDCLVTRADGTQYTIAARSSNNPRTTAPKADTNYYVAPRRNRFNQIIAD